MIVRGFKAGKIYRFYCVRASEQGLYSRSIDVTCVDSKFAIERKNISIKFVFLQAPVLDLDIIPSNPDSQGEVPYGSDVSYDISILTIPRSSIVLEISRNGVPLNNDKRFEIIPM